MPKKRIDLLLDCDLLAELNENKRQHGMPIGAQLTQAWKRQKQAGGLGLL